jgi:branched-chain amino acid transport system permease protein
MFFGAGGYGTALALKHVAGLPLLAGVGAGVLAAVVLALVLSPIVVRVSGTAFAMLHLAFAQVLYVLALKLRGITGGEDGIGNFPIPPLNLPGAASIPMKDSPENFYYFAIVILALSLWLMWYFTRTPFGQIQLAIRENAKRVDYLGFKVPQSKAVIYLVSAAFAGVAGSLYGLFHNLVSADGALGAAVSFAPIINIMIGGIGSFAGPILGTAIFQVIEELASRYTDRVELVMGLIFVLVIMYAPMGLLGTTRMLREKWLAGRAVREATQKTA